MSTQVINTTISLFECESGNTLLATRRATFSTYRKAVSVSAQSLANSTHKIHFVEVEIHGELERIWFYPEVLEVEVKAHELKQRDTENRTYDLYTGSYAQIMELYIQIGGTVKQNGSSGNYKLIVNKRPALRMAA